MARRTITAKATATLEEWLEEFMGGDLHFGDLPLAIEAYLHVGYSLGRASRQLEIEQLERAVNRLHNLAFETDKDRRVRLEARLSHGLEVATEERWEQLERDLRAMVAQRSEDAAEAVVEEQQNGRSGRDRADTLPHPGQRNQERAA